MSLPNAGPTALRIIVGAQMRRLREAAGISREDAAYHVRGSASKISRMELGQVGFKSRDIADLLTLYGITDEDKRGPVLALAREANTNGWWHRYDDVLPSWFHTYVGLEEAASAIRTYEIQFVPGLLQTMDYAHAVISAGLPGVEESELERRLSLRLERQWILRRPDPVTYWAVMDEAVLGRLVGNRSVMQAQLRHLLELSERSFVTIQVMPVRYGSYVADGGGFTILRFAEPELPDMVYAEQLVSAIYVDKREQVDHYRQAMDRLTVDALRPDQSVDLLAKVLKEL